MLYVYTSGMPVIDHNQSLVINVKVMQKSIIMERCHPLLFCFMFLPQEISKENPALSNRVKVLKDLCDFLVSRRVENVSSINGKSRDICITKPHIQVFLGAWVVCKFGSSTKQFQKDQKYRPHNSGVVINLGLGNLMNQVPRHFALYNDPKWNLFYSVS